MNNNLRDQFLLRKDIHFLNFGSFGATPKPVFDYYQQWQKVLEAEPVQFIAFDGVEYLSTSRAALAKFIHVDDKDDLVYITNPSYAVNIVAKSFPLEAGDEILATDIEYGACDRTWDYYCSQKKAIYKRQKIKTEQENIEELKTSLQARVFKNLSDVLINEDQYQFVSINLDKIISSSSSDKFDLQLQEGDILYIPTYNETVVVNGDVLYPVVVKYNENTNLNHYINQAGGFNITALRKRSYVVDANGSVKRTRNFLWFKFYPTVGPGSMVFVPKNNKPASTFNIDRTLGLVSSLVTTYLLVKNLSK